MDGNCIFWYRGKRWRYCHGAEMISNTNIHLLPTENKYDYSAKHPFPGPSIEEIESEIKHLEEEEMMLEYELNEIKKRKTELQKR